ncbi:hypothetical protein [Novipirellula caenicola]
MQETHDLVEIDFVCRDAAGQECDGKEGLVAQAIGAHGEAG